SLAGEPGPFATILNYAVSRGSFARSRIPAQVSFQITTNGGANFETDEREVTLEGRGWVDVDTIAIAGRSELPTVDWVGLDRWRMTVSLAPGVNRLDLIAFDPHSEVVGSDSIQVTSTAEPVEGSFVRGDANVDGSVDLSDAISILLGLFADGDIPCADAADVDDSERIDITDPITLLDYLFRGGSSPPAPFPFPGVDE